MTETLKTIAEYIALGMEGGAILIIAYGACEAAWGAMRAILGGRTRHGLRKEVWLSFGVWLLLALEFELAADIVRTAIAPTWNDIGQLAAIGAIRTVLNYFLELDLEKYGERRRLGQASAE